MIQNLDRMIMDKRQDEDEGREIRLRSEHRGKFEGEKKESGTHCRPQRRGSFGDERKKELGIHGRPQRRGEFRSESASTRGPAGQVLPLACMLMGMDCTETLLRDWPQRQRRAHSELGSSGCSAGQMLPPACILSSSESPGTLTHCRLNRRGTFCVYAVVCGEGSFCDGGCRVGTHALGVVQSLYP